MTESRLGPIRSDLVCRVVDCLRDHPHDDTVLRLARRLAPIEDDAVLAACEVLAQEGLARHAGGHWQLTTSGWKIAHQRDPYARID